MRCACVDIGSNTTRVLVADVGATGVVEVTCEKAFTRLGSVLRRTGALPEEALAAVADTVAVQVAVARSLGAEQLRTVATAAIRAAANADALVEAVQLRAGVEVEVLDGDEEARLAFSGATFGSDWPGPVAVVDVGGGSTEIAVGDPGAAGIDWAVSIPVGSSSLIEAGGALQAGARAALAGLTPPPALAVIAVGGSAAYALATGTNEPLDPERERLRPAALALLATAADLFGRPLQLGAGGLREGVCLELAGFTTAG